MADAPLSDREFVEWRKGPNAKSDDDYLRLNRIAGTVHQKPAPIFETICRFALLRLDLARYVNPWTIQIQRTDGVWIDFCHDAPLTLQDAEQRAAEYHREHQNAIFRVQPWLNMSQAPLLADANKRIAELSGIVGRLKLSKFVDRAPLILLTGIQPIEADMQLIAEALDPAGRAAATPSNSDSDCGGIPIDQLRRERDEARETLGKVREVIETLDANSGVQVIEMVLAKRILALLPAPPAQPEQDTP